MLKKIIRNFDLTSQLGLQKAKIYFFLWLQQTERAYQKQAGVNLNRKVAKSGTKKTRLCRNVGLGFKTPKEVSELWRNQTKLMRKPL
jgi:hypothetical protein